MKRPALLGRTIVGIRRMEPDHFAGRPAVMALLLDDGTWLWPSTDEDGPQTVKTSIIASDTRGTDYVLNDEYKETR